MHLYTVTASGKNFVAIILFGNFIIFIFFVPAPSIPTSLTYIALEPDISNGPRIKLTWQKPTEPNGVIRSYTVSYNHSGITQKEISGINALNYTVKVLGGVQYLFSVRAVTIKPGPDVSSIVKVPEYSKFSFHIKHILKILFVHVYANIYLRSQLMQAIFCVKNGNCIHNIILTRLGGT